MYTKLNTLHVYTCLCQTSQCHFQAESSRGSDESTHDRGAGGGTKWEVECEGEREREGREIENEMEKAR